MLDALKERTQYLLRQQTLQYGGFLRVPHDKDYSTWGSTLGSPCLGKLPHKTPPSITLHRPLYIPIVLPYIITYVPPFREFRLSPMLRFQLLQLLEALFFPKRKH